MLKRNRPSVKTQIERFPRIALEEMFWQKQPRKPLRKAGTNRKPNSVQITNPIKGLKGERSSIHTHIGATHANISKISLPSAADLAAMVIQVFSRPRTIRTHAIALINKQGKVIGYKVIRIPTILWRKMRTKKYLQDKRIKRLMHLAVSIGFFGNKKKKYLKERLEMQRLLEELEVQTRFVKIPLKASRKKQQKP